jgi:cell division protein DivIC
MIALKTIKKRKYPLLLALFLVWMLFFDRNNFIEQYKLRANLEKLKENKEYHLLQIEKAKTDRRELFTNSRTLEKFAREKYLMKKDDEDLFVIVPEKAE